MSDHWNTRALSWSDVGGSGAGVRVQRNDVTVAEDGLIYITDRLGGGLHIIEPTAAAGTVRPPTVA